jgi:hypothetical protein
VPAELLKWDRAHGKVLPGLTTRRHAEAALWCGAAIDVKHDPKNKCSQVVDKPKKGFHPTLTHASPAIAGSLVSHHSLGSFIFNDRQLVLFAAYTLLIAAVYAAGVFTLPLIHRFTQRKGS